MLRIIRQILLITVLIFVCACTSPPNAGLRVATMVAPTQTTTRVELTVFAAASLKEAFEAIGTQFEAAYPGVTVIYNFAGSQQLAQQIGQGAQVDVFASANTAQMQTLIRAGQVVSGTEHVFVTNRLVVIYPRRNPAKLEQLQDLAQPGLKLIFAAQAVPVG